MTLSATTWFIIQKDGLLLRKENDALLRDEDCNRLCEGLIRPIHIGELNGVNYYCAELNLEFSIPEAFYVVPLKKALSLINLECLNIAIKAYCALTWDRNHQFCSRCGRKTVLEEKQFERTCAACQLSFFPRISPCIIVLIKKEDHLLMARSPHFLPGVYGLIAGFVEIGESIEEAVHREVKEEVGIKIKNLMYKGSQPWPFPDSLMLAFTAEHASGEIMIDGEEIEEAGWYRYDNLPGRPSVAISIGASLIDNFIKEQAQ